MPLSVQGIVEARREGVVERRSGESRPVQVGSPMAPARRVCVDDGMEAGPGDQAGLARFSDRVPCDGLDRTGMIGCLGGMHDVAGRDRG